MSRSTGPTFSIRYRRARQPFTGGLHVWQERTMNRSVVAFAAICLAFCVAARAAEGIPDCPCGMPRLLEGKELPIEVGPTALQRQYDVLLGMSLEQIEYSHLGPIQKLVGDTGIVLSSDVAILKEGDSGEEILQLFKEVLLANGNETLTVTEKRFRRLRLSQSIRGLPVINSFVGIQYDDVTRHVSALIAANFIPDRGLSRTPKLSAQEAEQMVPGEVTEPPYLGYYVKCCGPTIPKLVWAIHVWSVRMGERFYVDAITGVVVDRVPTTTIG